ncbi:uncharacterized protein LOC107858509 isoform X2 [Capsicum annuum]|uniref:uncharacterized protein LOC107858509 isoform X2 n=1 Tax=Capsicum annuum TaxID=4072 RepID=UPI001FB0A45E|nr:uncharacterized protein LOC107858509 isoform X2 [Capsicum annuum]
MLPLFGYLHQMPPQALTSVDFISNENISQKGFYYFDLIKASGLECRNFTIDRFADHTRFTLLTLWIERESQRQNKSFSTRSRKTSAAIASWFYLYYRTRSTKTLAENGAMF